MNHVIFYNKDTKAVMATGSYSNPNDIPKQYPHIEVEEAIVEDPDSILEVSEDKKSVQIVGKIPPQPSIEELFALIQADLKVIKEKLKMKVES